MGPSPLPSPQRQASPGPWSPLPLSLVQPLNSRKPGKAADGLWDQDNTPPPTHSIFTLGPTFWKDHPSGAHWKCRLRLLLP